MLTKQPTVSVLYELGTDFANCESSRVIPDTSESNCHTLMKKMYTALYYNCIATNITKNYSKFTMIKGFTKALYILLSFIKLSTSHL